MWSLASLLLATPALALHGLKSTLLPLNQPASSSSSISPAVILASGLDPQEAQDATRVSFDSWSGPDQHTGFLSFEGQRPGSSPAPTVNSFFWYLPALNEDPDAPLLIWLQGGPGGSSLYGMFEEIGPMGIDGNMTIFERDPKFNWNQKYVRVCSNPQYAKDHQGHQGSGRALAHAPRPSRQRQSARTCPLAPPRLTLAG